MTYFKVSLHSHIPFFGIERSKNEEIKYVNKFLKKIKAIEGNLVLGITSFHKDSVFPNKQSNYYRFLEIMKKNYQNNIEIKYEKLFFCMKENKRKIYFVNTTEIETKIGHILILGDESTNNQKDIKQLFNNAKENGNLIIANHPLHTGILYRIYMNIFNSKRKISISMKNIKKYKNYFDALELNAYFKEDWKKISKTAKKNNINVVSDSDAHSIDEIFKSYYEIKNLDFSSPKKFKKSLKQAIRKGEFKNRLGRHSAFTKYSHVLDSIRTNILNKIK